jgi:2-isopropylmalate synthase
LLDAGTECICLVGKAWDYHVTETLGVDLDEGIRMVAESIEFLKSHGRRVFFDAEHFFDGFKSNPTHAISVLTVAADAGAERLILCDTNGGSLPGETLSAMNAVGESLPMNGLGVHFHDDVGTAVASSLAAAEAGVRQIQGCVNGYGERTGNANLSTLIPDLQLKMGRKVVSGDLAALTSISHHIAEIVNIALDPHLPYVGTSAFTHKAGLHTSALAKRSDAYEHEPPANVGNRTRMVVSELAGRASVLAKADELSLDVDEVLATAVVERVKELEHQGYHFEAADGSFELLVRRMSGWVNPYFKLESFRVQSDRRVDEEVVSEATVKLIVDGERKLSVGEGVGPVHALDDALRKALRDRYPEIDDLRLTDYRVRVLDSQDGTSARVRVLIETSNHQSAWGTIGVHENVIEASWQALSEGIVVGLMRLASVGKR